MSDTSVQARARDIVDIMSANGARFTFKPATGAMPASFVYEQERGSDRWRCRGLVAEAKADPALWHEVVEEIGRRYAHGGAG